MIKITPFDQNQFMTCYLIFNFRPTYFSYFRKITANSISHNVKKEVGPNGPIPVVKGLTGHIWISDVIEKHSELTVRLFDSDAFKIAFRLKEKFQKLIRFPVTLTLQKLKSQIFDLSDKKLNPDRYDELGTENQKILPLIILNCTRNSCIHFFRSSFQKFSSFTAQSIKLSFQN